MPLQIVSEKLVERLRSQPETGMTYQYVTVRLTNGREFQRVCVVEGLLSDHSGTWTPPFGEADIADIVVTHDRSGPPMEVGPT